ncbi:MAG: ABC transporter ATP-binding protein, partial [Actinobacteria bacterium]|nr:ABC transporter ATP-binding protein [Actinomycetota bacterium]
LRAALVAAGLAVVDTDAGLAVPGTPADIGALAYRAGVALSLLQPERAGLEEVFLELVGSGEGAAA